MIPRSPVTAILSAGLITFVSASLGQTTFYVNGSCGDDAWTGTNAACQAPDGPKRTIQAGIDGTVNGDTVIVADGTYTGERNKNLDFAGKAITVRSTNGPTTCIIACENDGRGVSFQSGELEDSVLDGFTIEDGNAVFGGGIYCTNSSRPTIRNCVIGPNQALSGGGIYCESRSTPTFIECVIKLNVAVWDGGGVYIVRSDNVRLEACTISGNTARWDGGGIFLFRSSPTFVTDCRILGNSAEGAGSDSDGGGVYIGQSSGVTIVNSIIADNFADSAGGGICQAASGLARISHSVVARNFAGNGGGCAVLSGGVRILNSRITENVARENGGGMYFSAITGNESLVRSSTIAANYASWNGGGVFRVSTTGALDPTIDNSIVWANAPTGLGGTIFRNLYYNDIQEWGNPGFNGNINDDPLFVDPDGPDNDPETWEDNDYHLQPLSPCIDTGDPGYGGPPSPRIDTDQEKRTWAGRVDMGIDEFGSYVFGDLNCDGLFNGADIDPFFLALGDPSIYTGQFPNCDALLGDMNGDGAVNGGDIDVFFACLGGAACP